jgi:putative membrane protein
MRMSIQTKLSFFPILLLAGATAFAQQSAMQQQQPSTPSPQTPSQANAPSPNPDASGPPASTPNYADQSFVEDTLKNNDTQVQLSQLAQQKASSGDVKDFSQKMIQIHTQLNQQLAPLAKVLAVNQNQKPSKKEKKEIEALQQLSGPDFDSAYLQAMASEQSHSLKEFKDGEKAQNPNIQKVSSMDEPILSQHYQILQKIAQTHNVTLASND